MKKTIYKVQTNFDGLKVPTSASNFNTEKEARENYLWQKSRKDCSFCNVIKVEVEVLDGDICEEERDTFRFGI